MQPPQLTTESKKFYELVYTWNRTYKFWVITPAHTPIPGSIKNPGTYGRYYRTTHGAQAYWGFKDEGYQAMFARTYNGTPWSPK